MGRTQDAHQAAVQREGRRDREPLQTTRSSLPGYRTAGPLTRQAIGDRVRRWGHQVGQQVWPHRLRHSHATQAIRSGCDVFTLQATLGHSSTSTTSNYVLSNPADSSSLRLG